MTKETELFQYNLILLKTIETKDQPEKEKTPFRSSLSAIQPERVNLLKVLVVLNYPILM